MADVQPTFSHRKKYDNFNLDLSFFDIGTGQESWSRSVIINMEKRYTCMKILNTPEIKKPFYVTFNLKV
jgi:hypothetical protein